jgi:hypothetical protein
VADARYTQDDCHPAVVPDVVPDAHSDAAEHFALALQPAYSVHEKEAEQNHAVFAPGQAAPKAPSEEPAQARK